MKQSKLKLMALACMALGGLHTAGAQTVHLPYFCGFETEAERDGWVIDNGTNANQWVMGEATAMRGTHSLYISPDGGATAGVTSSPGVSVVYKEFELPTGTYEVAFDWKSQGGGADTLLVAWVDDPEDPGLSLAPNVNGNFPLSIRGYEKLRLAGSTSWQHTTLSVRVRSNERGMLVFMFGKKTNIDLLVNPGACIDNVQIGSTGGCARPTDITVETEPASLRLAWRGEADSYNLAYKDTRGDVWTTVQGITDTTYTIQSPAAGVYTFWLNSVCGTDTTSWSVYQYVVVTDAAKNCINYIDLHSDAVHTYYGKYTNPKEEEGIVDFGEEDYKQTRHAVNILPDRYDPNTGYQLRTIPEGELASIRLGNAEVNYQAENITYDYVVDSASSILLMKYAVLLQNAHLSDLDVQSRFQLDILDEWGNVIDDCASIEFYPSNAQEWTLYVPPGMSATDGECVLWKDWTDIGVDVSAYAGEKIQISLTTYDCNGGMHYGYAYFTLNCVPKTISGLTCGEAPDSISAPEGFLYEWYHVTDMDSRDDTISTARTLYINPNDTSTYICRVISPEDSACYFEMQAIVAPRFPKAEASATLVQEDCQNKVQFENLSYIYTENGKINEQLQSFYWDFGELGTSEEMNPLVVYDEPGTYSYSLHVAMEGGCEDEWTGTVDIPRIGDVTDTIPVWICREEGYYEYNGRYLTTEGFHDFHYTSPAGCDSLVVIDLHFHEAFDEVRTDTVCFGESVEFQGGTYDRTGVYTETYTASTGCDSTYTLDLTVLPEVVFSATATPALEGNDGAITIDAYPDGFAYYTLNGVENAPLEGLVAGDYELTVYVQHGTVLCERTETVTVASTCLVLDVEDGPYETCADAPEVLVPYTIQDGVMNVYDVAFDEAARQAGFEDAAAIAATADSWFVLPMPQVSAPAYVRPGHYAATITFPGQPCDTAVVVPFSILYPSSILSQRWENVLFVQNADYNGGYDFSAYQWYKGGEAIEGATASYLHVPEGLDTSAEYSVALTRSDDGVTVPTCPVTPRVVDGVTLTLQQNVVPEGGEVRLTSDRTGTATLYDVSGQLVSRHALEAGDNVLPAPGSAGYYLLRVVLDNGRPQTYHLQVVNN